MYRYLGILFLITLAACGATAAPPPTAVPTVVPAAPVAAAPTLTAVPTEPPTVPPPTLAPASPTPEPPSPTIAPVGPLYKGAPEGRDADGAFTLGDPGAPLTLIDYSDFL